MKSSQITVKETTQRFNKERKQLENKLEVLTNYKLKHDAEEKEFRKKQKKLIKKSKKAIKEDAKTEVQKMKECRTKFNEEQNNNSEEDATETENNNKISRDESSFTSNSKDYTNTENSEPAISSSPALQNEAKPMSDQEFRKLTEKYFDTKTSESIHEAFTKVEEKFEKGVKMFDDNLSKSRM